MKIRIPLTLCLLLLFRTLLQAQSDVPQGKYRFVSLKFHSGRHYYTGTALKDKLKNGYAAFEMRVGWQSKGKQTWQREHLYPSYGIGVYNGYVGDIDIFGSPHAAFGFITFPVTQAKRHVLQIEPALGLTYNLKPYNPEHNVINDAIGSKFAVYFAMHIGGKYRLNREVDFLYGYDLTHFSNGRTVTPNLGLNMMGFSFGARYNFNAMQRQTDNSLYPATVLNARPVLPPAQAPSRIRENNIAVYQAVGTVQNKDDAATNHRYLVSTTVLEYQHKFNTKHAVSVGVDAFIDPSMRDTAEYPKNKAKQEQFFPAAHAGYEFMFWRLAIRFQLGVHLSSMGRELKGNTFIRPSVRYQIGERLFAQLGLKTMQGGTADWVEWGLGYHIFHAQRNRN